MKRRSIFPALTWAVNLLLAFAVLLTAYGALWEYSTRSYLRGFSDAVAPYATTPLQKIEAILAWMGAVPSAPSSDPDGTLLAARRGPESALNEERLRLNCGAATNAFENLADSLGLEVRRLLLIGPDGTAAHIVDEVRLDGRWIVVDPLFRTLLRDHAGRLLTSQELRSPATLQEATGSIAGYLSSYNYQNTEHVRIARIPWVGGLVQKALDFAYPGWKESLDWTLLLDQKSYAVLVAGILLLSLSLLGRLLLTCYQKGRPRLPLPFRSKPQKFALSECGFSDKPVSDR